MSERSFANRSLKDVRSPAHLAPPPVMGFANHSKNLLIGLGGKEAIDLSHFIGAVHGIERMLGKADNPLRRILNYASEHFLSKLPVVYALTVIGRADDGALHMRGLFVGTDLDCFTRACQLSAEVNITKVERPLKKVVAYLSEEEFRSTWLGNKSIYRTRMAVADDGELIVLAPGVEVFGECSQLDGVIRRHGYRTTPEVMQMLEDSLELKQSLSVAAHLIHGSTEKRFRVIYCPGGLSKKEIEGVGYEYGDIAFYSKRLVTIFPPANHHLNASHVLLTLVCSPVIMRIIQI
jgi:nickel-dependent lactate racemase